jgi:hypothetical protein
VDDLVGRSGAQVTQQRLQAAIENAQELHMPFMEGMIHFHLMTLHPAVKKHAHNAKQLFGQAKVASKHYAGKGRQSGLLPPRLRNRPSTARCCSAAVVSAPVCVLTCVHAPVCVCLCAAVLDAELCDCNCTECKALCEPLLGRK